MQRTSTTQTSTTTRTRLTAVAGLALAHGALAQDTMSWAGTQTLAYTGSVQDFVIPDAPGRMIDIRIEGADGGESRPLSRCFSAGGHGASVTGQFTIGDGPGDLPGGGLIRFVIGGRGEDDSSGHDGAGGGGGIRTTVFNICNGSSNTLYGRNATTSICSTAEGTGGIGGNCSGNGGARPSQGADGGGGIWSNGSGDNYGSSAAKGFPAGGNGGTNGITGGNGGWGSGGGELIISSRDITTPLRAELFFSAGTLPAGDYVIGVAGRIASFGENFAVDTTSVLASSVGNFTLRYRPFDGQRSVISGSLDSTDDVQYYSFTIGEYTDLGVVAHDEGVFTLDTVGTDHTVFDAQLTLFLASGFPLNLPDDASDQDYYELTRSFSPGVYYFAVTPEGTDFDRNFGVLFRDSVNDADAAGPYAGNAGTGVHGGTTSIDDGDFVDFYRIEIADRATIDEAINLGVIGVEGTTTFNTNGSDFVTAIALYNANGTIIATDATDANPASITRTLAPGTYYLMATGAPNFPAANFQTPGFGFNGGTLNGNAGNKTIPTTTVRSTGSRLYQVTVAASCDADWDNNGIVDVLDLLDYLGLWYNADPAADIDSNTVTDVVDLLAYLSSWFTGCP